MTAWGFVRQPTGFLPTEDQGYAILVSILPEGASQPRSREVADKINAMLSRRPTGVAGWVTIGGFSILDFANVPNVSTTFIVYKDWNERGKALTQDRIVSSLNRELSGIQEALAFVVIPPPIRGLGQTGGFQMMVEDRRSLGLSELSQQHRRARPDGELQSGPAGPRHHLQHPQPPALPGHRPDQGGVPAGARSRASSTRCRPTWAPRSSTSSTSSTRCSRSTSRPTTPIVCSPRTSDISTSATRTERWSR